MVSRPRAIAAAENAASVFANQDGRGSPGNTDGFPLMTSHQFETDLSADCGLLAIGRHPAAWLAGGARATSAAARANTRPIITTTGPPVVAAARRCGRSAMVAAMTASSGRVALIMMPGTASTGMPAARQAAT